MYKYVEVIEKKNRECALRMDVTKESDRDAQRCLDGVKINLNHKEFKAVMVEYEAEQPKISF